MKLTFLDYVLLIAALVVGITWASLVVVREVNRPYDDCVNSQVDDGVSESNSRLLCIRGY